MNKKLILVWALLVIAYWLLSPYSVSYLVPFASILIGISVAHLSLHTRIAWILASLITLRLFMVEPLSSFSYLVIALGFMLVCMYANRLGLMAAWVSTAILIDLFSGGFVISERVHIATFLIRIMLVALIGIWLINYWNKYEKT